MKQHVTVVAALQIASGALKIFAAVIVFVAVVGGGLISGDVEAMAITGVVGPAVSFFLVMLAVPSILGGVGLLKGKEWARVLVLVLSVFNLLDFPIGTMISLYTFWVLLHGETSALFNGQTTEAKQPAYS